MGKRKTNAEFIIDLRKVDGNTYIPLTTYKNAKEKMYFYCMDCGSVFKTAPDKMINRKIMCPNCALILRGLKRLLSTDSFKDKVKKLVGNEYTVLSDYRGAKKYIKLRHNICNYVFYTTPDSFLRGKRCSKCVKQQIHDKYAKSTAQFIHEVYKLVGEEYTVIGKYKNNKTPILIKHNKCGKDYMVIPSDFLRGSRCRYCANNVKSNTAEFKKKVSSLVGNEYTVIGKYENAVTPIKIKHNKCNHVYLVTPNKFLNGRRCPICKESSGESLVRKFLDSVNIKYIYGYQIPDLIDKGKLHFDFWIPEMRLAIEYDGIQHYHMTEYFGGKNGFAILHKHDLMKNNYCKKHSITLVRIPFTYSKYEQVSSLLSNYF